MLALAASGLCIQRDIASKDEVRASAAVAYTGRLPAKERPASRLGGRDHRSLSDRARQRLYLRSSGTESRRSRPGRTNQPPSQTATTHNAGRQHTPILSTPLCECGQQFEGCRCEISRFSAGFVEGDGLKNRRLRQCKMSISEVLIPVTLSVRGVVAERLKAAVC